MTLEQEAERVKQQFVAGHIPPEDLHGQIDPILNSAAFDVIRTQEAAAEAKRIANAIERIVYTKAEPKRSIMIASLLDEAIVFVRGSRP